MFVLQNIRHLAAQLISIYINYCFIQFQIPAFVYTRDIGRMANNMAEGELQTIQINCG